MRDAHNPTDATPQAGQISGWAFDTIAGRISAVDGQGRELMAISADPLFGPRLAAAFGWPAMATGSWQQMLPQYPMRGMSAPPRPAPLLQAAASVAARTEEALQV